MTYPRRHASVLVVVLWACLGLVSITLMFGHSMLMTFRGADNDLSGRQAEQAIEGAARFVESLMATVETPGQLPDPLTYESEDVAVGEAAFWLVGRPADTSTGLTREFGLVDEASKLNLNTATAAMLGALPGITDELVAAILDWRDADDDVTPDGAEAETYLQRQPGYRCKNLPFESVEELALVNGVTREILYGEDANQNGVLEPNENDGEKTPPFDDADGTLEPGILEYLTVFRTEPVNDPAGQPRININVSPLPGDLLTKVEELLGNAVAVQVGGRVIQPPYASVLQYYIDSELTAAEFSKLAPYLTATAATPGTPVNAVNANTASEAVLTCLLGADKAAAIVAARLSRTPTDTSIDWLVQALGGKQTARADAGNLTVWTWQVSADVAAVGRHGRGYRRSRLVIDSSADAPRIIYRRDLASLGWALGSEIRETLAQTKEFR